ncbi:hypothetical protein GALMADRAFT_35102, partial [Galerina marginata CBS 339.88]
DIEAQWAKMSAVHEQLEVLQQKDWKELSLDDKKASFSCLVAFGPHGPRSPVSQPGDNFKIAPATTLLV